MLLFIDESGTDHKQAPYEVLAGITVHEKQAWALIQAIQNAQLEYFGILLGDALREFKGGQLLKTKTFRLAAQLEPIPSPERSALAFSLLEKGRLAREGQETLAVSKRELTAYGQACLEYTHTVLALCKKFGVQVFASIVETTAQRPANAAIRKDVVYLLERFHASLSSQDHGIIVFDELDVTQSRRMTSLLRQYFSETRMGQQRAQKILPEPFFVHSDLTTLVQVADLVAYCINWGWRLEGKTLKPTRVEIEPFAVMVGEMAFAGHQRKGGKTWPLHGFCHITDLRPSRERTGQE
jgi:hypothetical protein